MLDLSPDDLLTTTRAVRRRLDLSRPVERSTVIECLEIAAQAPNGSNQQRWDWVVVDDPQVRSQVADIYRGAMADLIADADKPTRGIDYTTGTQARISASVAHLRDHLDAVPVVVIPTISGRLEGAGAFLQASVWGSILPAVWSFMLALRSRGLGSVWTTAHLYREQQMAELLGIPFDRVTQAGLFPVAYTVGSDFGPAERAPMAESTHWNRW
jgi:nitroreductase